MIRGHLHYLVVLLSIFLIRICGFTKRFVTSPLRRKIYPRLYSKESGEASSTWWKNGVNFDCSGCGRCCMNDGEVWLDTDEFYSLCKTLSIPFKSAIELYAEKIMANWVKLKDKDSSVEGVHNQCVFLDDDGKQCTIYSSRPTQCRTYPYWPNLLQSREQYDSEGVLPENVGIDTDRHWTPDGGCCEGINNINGTVVPARTVLRNLELYNTYLASFPFMENGEDHNRLISSLEVIDAVVKSTKAWVNQFVIKYDLCPFARGVFEGNKVRYRVYLGSDINRLKQRLKYEMLHLLTTSEEQDSTTLLVTPFLFSDFVDFNHFIQDYEVGDMRQTLLSFRSPAEKGRLLNRATEKKFEENKELQIASFHPSFQWANSDFEDALNFEKRSPFPVINLLRAGRIREYADADSTKRIAGHNKQSLLKAGSVKLRDEMEGIIKLALSGS